MIRIDFGEGKMATFQETGRKRYPVGDGCVYVNGEVRLADGTLCKALLGIDESSSGELFSTGVFVSPTQITFQDDPDFLEVLDRGADAVFPYKYRPLGTVLVDHDHHIGDDGWSV